MYVTLEGIIKNHAGCKRLFIQFRRLYVTVEKLLGSYFQEERYYLTKSLEILLFYFFLPSDNHPLNPLTLFLQLHDIQKLMLVLLLLFFGDDYDNNDDDDAHDHDVFSYVNLLRNFWRLFFLYILLAFIFHYVIMRVNELFEKSDDIRDFIAHIKKLFLFFQIVLK